MKPDCSLCKWMNQGETCCKCFNPLQRDKNLREYVYFTFYCGLFERGKRLTEEAMEQLGYIQAYRKCFSIDGKDIGWKYWHIPQSPTIRT